MVARAESVDTNRADVGRVSDHATPKTAKGDVPSLHAAVYGGSNGRMDTSEMAKLSGNWSGYGAKNDSYPYPKFANAGEFEGKVTADGTKAGASAGAEQVARKENKTDAPGKSSSDASKQERVNSNKSIMEDPKASPEQKLAAAAHLYQDLPRNKDGTASIKLNDGGKERQFDLQVTKAGDREMINVFGKDDRGGEHVALRGLKNADGSMDKQKNDSGPVSIQGDWWAKNQKGSTVGATGEGRDTAKPEPQTKPIPEATPVKPETKPMPVPEAAPVKPETHPKPMPVPEAAPVKPETQTKPMPVPEAAPVKPEPQPKPMPVPEAHPVKPDTQTKPMPVPESAPVKPEPHAKPMPVPEVGPVKPEPKATPDAVPPAKPGDNTQAKPEVPAKPESIEPNDGYHATGKLHNGRLVSNYGGRWDQAHPSSGGKDGNITASGEVFNHNEMTAASRDLPFGTRVRVTDEATGKSVIVKINDRGPFHRPKKGAPYDRDIDLSIGAAKKLGDTGVPVVSWQIVEKNKT